MASDDPVRLRNAQRAIRDAYFEHESGLYTLNCVPGAGKSEVATHIAAEDVLRRYVAGDSTPEQRVAVISFTRSEAETIVPEICDRLREIVDHGLVPAASSVSDAELEHLLQRIRRAPFVGTIDSVLRDVLREIARDVGFEEMPVVGNTARQQQVHAACYQRLQADRDLAQRLARLEDAYPDGEYDDAVSDMLEEAITYCRNRRVATDTFRARLEQTVADTYPGGSPESFADIVAAIERFVGAAVAERANDDVDDDVRAEVCAADARLYEDWRAMIDDFCVVLDAYRRAYRRIIRDRGVVSHTDVAYLVDAYLDGRLDDVADGHRTRIKQRYHTRVQSVIIDEAQDVSAIQHAALSHLVTPSTRVFCAGDLLQSVYRWRQADPTLFETATADGRYLGVEWDRHEHRTANTTYRCVPDIASAINKISDAALTDSARGDLGALDVHYPGLEADRESTDGPSVHIAAFDPPPSHPDSPAWINSADGCGEAPALAAFLSNGLADGTFTDEHDDPLGITVLFRWASKMDAYEDAFDAEGLSVRTTSENLFECDAVAAVLDVCAWLAMPTDTKHTRQLVTESSLGLDQLERDFETHHWSVAAVRNNCELTDAHKHVLAGLAKLRDRRGRFHSQPVRTYVEDIIETLALRADPHGQFDSDSAQRVANLDALVATLDEWEADDHLDLRELTTLVDPFRQNPYLGPNQPSTADTRHDVEFRTIHDAKGGQNDIVVVANPGFELRKHSPQAQRLITQADTAGLAPPANTDIPGGVSLPPYTNGLYDPDASWDRDVGLRWAANHWCDDIVDGGDPTSLVGPDRLTQVTANERAEAWRLLYVALTRAQDHLVVPLPQSMPVDPKPRDRWLDTLRDALNFTGDEATTYTRDPAADATNEPFDVGVNDTSPLATRHSSTTADNRNPAATPPRRSTLDPWVPRFINPSTLDPLTQNPTEQALNHLLDNPLHTPANDVPDHVPLPFDRLGPDDVGTCLHKTLTTLVERTVSDTTRQPLHDSGRQVFDDVVADHAPRITDRERNALFTFFQHNVLDDFYTSDLWTRIQQAEHVTVERPIDGLVTLNDIEFELHGTCDFLIEFPAGDRHLVDVKITLTEQTAANRRRYELQTAAYAYLFEQQNHSTALIHWTVEAFGIDRTTITPSAPPAIIEHHLATLLN